MCPLVDEPSSSTIECCAERLAAPVEDSAIRGWSADHGHQHPASALTDAVGSPAEMVDAADWVLAGPVLGQLGDLVRHKCARGAAAADDGMRQALAVEMSERLLD